MAGGEGTRLRPMTANQPKPMLPVANRPIMEHVLRLLKRHGFDETIVTVQFLAALVRNYFGDGEDVASYTLVDLHRTFHEEVPQIGNETAGQRFLRAAEARRSFPLWQNHLGWRCAWVTPLWRNGTQRFFCLALPKVVSRCKILQRREWMPIWAGG